MDDGVKMYKVRAGYCEKRPECCGIYYVFGRTKKEATKRFKERISWLDVYEVVLLDDSKAEEVMNDSPRKRILF